MALGIHGKSKFSISYFLFHLREIETIDSIFKYILCLEHESTYLWSGLTSALLKIVPKLITCVSNEDLCQGSAGLMSGYHVLEVLISAPKTESENFFSFERREL